MSDPDRKRALITGASRGIGRITALDLAKKGFDLTLVVRDKGRGEQVASEIKAAGAAMPDLLVGDLSSMKEVARVAKEFLARHDRLSVLVNNAGAILTERTITVDGYEGTFATNHLAYFVLTNLLRPALEKAAPSRVVVVASEAHRRARIPWDDLMHEQSYSSWKAYGESKLANVLFARELARRLADKGVTVNSLHPGFVATNFGWENRGILKYLIRIAMVFAITEVEGAKTTIWAATSDEAGKITGKYLDCCRETTPSRAAQSDEDAARLWKVSEELVARAGVALS
jgi:NAD(P)-dependent dehydrogenase (short-subunit alcohol dehydrogenase family)